MNNDTVPGSGVYQTTVCFSPRFWFSFFLSFFLSFFPHVLERYHVIRVTSMTKNAPTSGATGGAKRRVHCFLSRATQVHSLT